MRRRAHAHGTRARLHREAHGAVAHGDPRTGLAQLLDHRVEARDRRLRECHAAARGRRGREEGARLDAVRHHRMLDAVQRGHTLHGDHVAAVALDARAHADEAAGEVDHFRLAGGVLEHRFALGEARRHHQVLGAGHGDRIHEDARALEPRGGGVDVALLDRHVRAHRGEPLDVQVHGPLADGAAARQRDARLVFTSS
jgi:hypothetical protein